jgi:hypothetical protein
MYAAHFCLAPSSPGACPGSVASCLMAQATASALEKNRLDSTREENGRSLTAASQWPCRNLAPGVRACCRAGWLARWLRGLG